MRSPVQALLWEQWRRLRWPMVFALVLMVSASLLDYILSKTSAVMGDPDGLLSFAMIALCMCVFVAFLLCSHSEASDLRLTLPSRLYTLPVRTHVLVNCELFSRLAAIGLLAFVMLGTHYLLFGDEYLRDASFVWKAPLAVMCMFAFIQGVCWWPKGLWILAGVVSGTLLLTRALRIIAGPLFGANWEANLFAVGTLALFAGAGYLIALGGVKVDRLGAWTSIRRRLGQILRVGTARGEGFVSPAHAQLWFEWRRKGKYVPIVAIAFVALWSLVYRYLLFPDQLNVRLDAWQMARAVPWPTVAEEMAAMIVGGSLFVCPLVAAFVVGMLIPALDHRDHTSGFSCFLMTRPMRTRELAAARLKMGALSLGLTYVLVSLIMIVFLGLPTFLNALKFIWEECAQADTPEWAFLPIGLAFGAFALAWLLLWFSLPLSGLWLILCAMFGLAAYLRNWDYPALWGSVLHVPTAILLVAIVAAFVLAHRRRLLMSRALLAVIALASASVFAVLIWRYSGLYPHHPMDHAEAQMLTAFWMAISLLPAVAFVWEPLKLHWFRHR